MKISTRTRYGLRALVDLAKHFGRGPVSMEQISVNQEISRKYLHAILSTFQSGGIVQSIRGPKGGFTLTRPPDEIRLGDAVRMFEGSLTLVDCVGDSSTCDRSPACVTALLWSELSRMLNEKLDKMTLAQLMKWEETLESRASRTGGKPRRNAENRRKKKRR